MQQSRAAIVLFLISSLTLAADKPSDEKIPHNHLRYFQRVETVRAEIIKIQKESTQNAGRLRDKQPNLDVMLALNTSDVDDLIQRQRLVGIQLPFRPEENEIGSLTSPKVISIIDNNAALVLSNDRTYHLCNHSVKGRVDGDVLVVPLLLVKGTYQYTAAPSGAKTTVISVRPVDDEKQLSQQYLKWVEPTAKREKEKQRREQEAAERERKEETERRKRHEAEAAERKKREETEAAERRHREAAEAAKRKALQEAEAAEAKRKADEAQRQADEAKKKADAEAAEAKAKAKREMNTKTAATKLKLARDLYASGSTGQAKHRLKELIKDYPDTPAAKEAAEQLKKWE